MGAAGRFSRVYGLSAALHAQLGEAEAFPGSFPGELSRPSFRGPHTGHKLVSLQWVPLCSAAPLEPGLIQLHEDPRAGAGTVAETRPVLAPGPPLGSLCLPREALLLLALG